MTFRSRAARRIVPLALLAALTTVAATPPAGAATIVKRDQWQVVTTAGPRLQDDAANLFRITPATDRFTLGKVRWIVTWANFSAIAKTQDLALRATEDGRGALVDRALTPAEARRYTQRVLWREADVLVVHPTNPVCAAGVTGAQATGLLDGSITSWPELVAAGAWPSTIAPELHGYRPRTRPGGYVDPYFGATTYGAQLFPTTEQSARTAIAGDAQAFAPMRYSAVRGRTDVCAVPVDGVKPDDATVRAATYPTSYAVRWVTLRAQTARSRMALNRFTTHLFGARGAAYLRTEAGRNRLR